MDRLKIAIAVIFAVASLFVGYQLAIDNQSSSNDNTPNRALPAYNTGEDESEVRSVNVLRDFNDAIVNIAERTNPTVVTITTTQTVRMRQQSPFSFFFDDPRFDREREFQREGLGSGVIVSRDGYIITNNHVIQNADEIRIIMYSGDELDAEIIGTDPASDIAILKVESNNTFPAIKLGNSDNIRIGEIVLAIGSPLGRQFAHTVSQGIISASGRSSLGLNVYENYIQTDAAINPGNSGGPLINIDGELIGINTAIASRSGGSQGIGFAIPVNMARNVMEALITEGRVARGYLGIGFGGEVDRTMARALGLDRPRGIVVGEVVPDEPADRAGIEEGDVILTLDNEEVRSWMDFRVAIGNRNPGDRITLGIFRDGERLTKEIELGELEPEELAANMSNDELDDLREELGFSVDELTESVRQQLRLSPGVEGVYVNDISQSSTSYRQGLRRGDVIQLVANQPVITPGEFYGSIRALKQEGTEAVLLRIHRQGNNVFIAIEL